MIELGFEANIDAVKRYVSLEGKRILEIGCGGFGFTSQLVESGAYVVAIDPDPIQAKRNRGLLPINGIEFHECGAEELPADNRSIDGVVLAHSLHHIPELVYPVMFSEIFRVLQTSGFLVVIEPTYCSFNNVIRLFHNEDSERVAAQKSLSRFAKPRFGKEFRARLHSIVQYESFEQFVDRFASKSFNSLYSRGDIEQDAVESAFLRNGGLSHEFKATKLLAIFDDFMDNQN
ncbi:MAG: class I SAM-dependent methyltransferase [Planctomycetota bacterium]